MAFVGMGPDDYLVTRDQNVLGPTAARHDRYRTRFNTPLDEFALVVLSLYIKCNVRVSPYEASHGSLKSDDAVLVVASIAVMSPHRSCKNPGCRKGQNS